MAEDPDPVVEAFRLLAESVGKLSDASVCSQLRQVLPGLSKAELQQVARDARRLYDAYGQANFYHKPSGAAVRAKALPFLRQKAPGLSERAYAYALSRIVRDWLY